MQYFTSILSAALLATQTAAFPNALGGLQSWGRSTSPRSAVCMSDSQAQTVANNFRSLIQNYSDALANATLTADFHDYSDSVNELINNGCDSGAAPLGSATFSSRAAFMQGQGSQPTIPWKQLNIWHTCSAVIVRWVSTQTPQQVTGVLVLETVYSKGAWLISTVYSEFNSGAWLVNLGQFHPTNCTA